MHTVMTFFDASAYGNVGICRAYVILKPEYTFPLSYYLIPFTGVVGMIIIVMCVVLVSMHMM